VSSGVFYFSCLIDFAEGVRRGFASDKIVAWLPGFIRICTYFRQITGATLLFCPNLHLLQTNHMQDALTLSEPAPTSDKSPVPPSCFVRTCTYFRQITGATLLFCPNLYLLQTNHRRDSPVLSEPVPTSDKSPPRRSCFVRTCTYFRQITGATLLFCPNLYLLQTNHR
jgi:hypothetical protein